MKLSLSLGVRGIEVGEYQMIALKTLVLTYQHIPLAALSPEPTWKADFGTHLNPDQHFSCWCSKLHKAVRMTPVIKLAMNHIEWLWLYLRARFTILVMKEIWEPYSAILVWNMNSQSKEWIKSFNKGNECVNYANEA